MEQGYFWANSLKVNGAKILSSRHFLIKSFENLNVFKNLMKNWNDNSCSCTVCTK